MKRNHLQTVGILFVVALMFGITGCREGKYTGGGTIASTVAGKANFGFVIDTCNPITNLGWGVFTFNDKGAKVKFQAKGDVLGIGGFNGVMSYYILDYRSTDPKQMGEGTVWVGGDDQGEGRELHGKISIYVMDGPYGGYNNSGDVSGNIVEHECDPI